MIKEGLKTVGLTDDQVSKIYEDYGKNHMLSFRNSNPHIPRGM